LTFPGEGEHDRRIVVVLALWFVAGLLATSSDRHFFAHDGLFSIGSAVVITIYALCRGPRATRNRAKRLVSRGVWLALSLSTAALLAFEWTSIPKGIATARELRMGRHSSTAAPTARLLAEPFKRGRTEFPLLSVGSWQLGYAPEREDLQGLQAVTHVIVEHSRPTDYLEVWGLEPSLYFLSGRRPASRFLYSLPLTGNFGGVHARGYKSRSLDEEFLHDLARHRPRLIVLASVDRDPVSTLPSFAAMLHHTYRRLVTLHGFDVYALARTNKG
jgi:hypothetical protein